MGDCRPPPADRRIAGFRRSASAECVYSANKERLLQANSRMGISAAGTWGSLVRRGLASLLSRYTGCLALTMAAAEPPQSPDTRIVSKPTTFLSTESMFWPQAWRSRHVRSNRKYVRTKSRRRLAGKVPGDQSSPSCLQLCDFSRQGTAMPPILIPGHTGNANSAACGHVERRYESRFPQCIPQQSLVVPLYAIHAATFLRGCYGWNSPNWLPPRAAGGQRPEMWQEPLEMSGFLQAQTRTSRP